MDGERAAGRAIALKLIGPWLKAIRRAFAEGRRRGTPEDEIQAKVIEAWAFVEREHRGTRESSAQ
jgi:hypothetical protein